MSQYNFIFQMIRAHAHASRSQSLAFTFIGEMWGELKKLTYAELDDLSSAAAADLQSRFAPGDRVVLMFPQSLEFVVGFMACLKAGVVAVPLCLPYNKQEQARLLAVLDDCHPRAIMSLSSINERPECRLLAQLKPDVQWLDIENLMQKIVDKDVDYGEGRVGEELAFLQYTSGSTGTPKGVMVSHANIMANAWAITESLALTEADVGVSWLPLHHDMGLIGFVLGTVYVGGVCHLMSPLDFLRQPLKWLNAMSSLKATISGAPSFAYSLCAKVIPAEVAAGLDLSAWRLALNGAEPVRHAALEKFSERFGASGFNAVAHFPCYGLAEATLFVSGGAPSEGFRSVALNRADLERGTVTLSHTGQVFVTAGKPSQEMEIRIADPETGEERKSDRIGEIWLRGPSVALGYWHGQSTQDDGTFTAKLQHRPGNYLRTGDLGFTSASGDLVVTGRLKDLIIVAGKNYYPQDIEAIAEQADPSIRMGGVAAFHQLGNDSDGAWIVAELHKNADPSIHPESVKLAIKREVHEISGLRLVGVLLVEAHSIPKTTSGKVRRRECRQLVISGAIKEKFHAMS